MTSSSIPGDLRYTQTHEWARIDGDTITIGITDHAQSELGDIVYLDLPEPGRMLQKGEQFGEVESVKAVSEIYAPVSGEVVDANTGIADTTEVLNEDPYGKGWLIKMRLSDSAELSSLMEPADYEKFLAEGGGH